MQGLEPDDKSLVINFACKVPHTMSMTPAEQEEGTSLAAIYMRHARLMATRFCFKTSTELVYDASDRNILGHGCTSVVYLSKFAFHGYIA